MVIQEMKMKYNHILNRYYNGCNYIEANPDEFNKYFYKIMEFKKELEDILKEIIQTGEIPTNEEILGGFEIC